MTAGRNNSKVLSKSWCTPEKYLKIIRCFFDNDIQLDPCSNEESIVMAKKEIKLPEDGLSLEWNYETIYVNPPYGRDYERKTSIKDWIKKCCDSHFIYNSEVLALIPVATNTSHWKNYIFEKACAICFLSDTRVKFIINGSDDNKGAPMACCIVYWGKYKERFKEVFNSLGSVIFL